MNIKFNSDDFNKKFGVIVEKAIPELTEKGLGRAMANLFNDCINEVPTVPLKESWLRGSGSWFVQNKLAGVSNKGKQGFANTSHTENISAGEFVGVIGFNTPYAARIHEGIGLHFREPSSGAKYLESKLHRKKDVYMKIIANTIKEGG